MIYAAVKQYEKSLQAFDNCLIMPAAITSKIMVEAAKKQILVSLIVHGKHVKGHYGGQTLSVGGLNEAMTPWKKGISAYLELVNVFKRDDLKKLTAFIGNHQQSFISDRNFGLVKQVREAYIKNMIKNLTKTFITMSLTDLAVRVGLENAKHAEKYLVEMIEANEISARISQKDGTVHFMDNQELYESPAMLARINEKISDCVALEKYLNTVSDQVVTSPAYAKWACENENRTANKNTL